MMNPTIEVGQTIKLFVIRADDGEIIALPQNEKSMFPAYDLLPPQGERWHLYPRDLGDRFLRQYGPDWEAQQHFRI